MREYCSIGLVGQCNPAVQQSLHFLLASFRYQVQHVIFPVASISPSLKLWLVIGDISSAAYHYLYHEQNLPTLIWGVQNIPQPLPTHVHHRARQIAGGELIQLLDTLRHPATEEFILTTGQDWHQ